MLHTRVEEGAPRMLELEELHTMVEDGALGRQGVEGEHPPHALVPHKLGELHTMEEGAGAPHTLGVWVCCICGRLGRGSYSCAWCGQCGHP